MAKVFLSSNFTELRNYRTAAADAIERAGRSPLMPELQIIRMETFSAAERAIETFCRDRVRECDLFVLLLGTFCGTKRQNSDITYTELEFQAAMELPVKPRLVFEVERDIACYFEAEKKYRPATGLDWQMQRMEEFKKKAFQGISPGHADNPDQLATRLLQALQEHFGRRAAAQAPPLARNEMLLWAADREPQITAFSRSFEFRSGAPQIYILHGDLQQQHRRCVEKLVCFHTNLRRKGASHEETAETPPYWISKPAKWPDAGPEVDDGILKSDLALAMFRAVREAYPYQKQFRPQDFLDLACGLRSPFVVIRHAMPWRLWGPRAHKMIREWCLPFWDDIARIAKPRQPQFLVFFEITYPENGAPDEAGVRDELSAAFEIASRSDSSASGRACSFLLPRLKSIDEDDLKEFAESYSQKLRPYLGATPLTKLFSSFPVPMADLEETLDKLMDDPISFAEKARAPRNDQ
jgi:hypothetical protein